MQTISLLFGPVQQQSIAPQEAEQNSMMGKLDEGLDDFYSKKVVRLSFRWLQPLSQLVTCLSQKCICFKCVWWQRLFLFSLIMLLFFRLPSVKASPPQENTDKKRESRMSGIFNLIKSRTSKSNSTATSPLPTSPSAQPVLSVSSVAEETPARSPTPPGKVPAVAAAAEPQQELHKSRTQSSNLKDPEKEAGLTAEVAGENKHKEALEKAEPVERKEHPVTQRHVGVPMMGKDLLAEMKARQGRTRQEKLPDKKVGGASHSFPRMKCWYLVTHAWHMHIKRKYYIILI